MGINSIDKQARDIVDTISDDHCPTADTAVDDFNKAIQEQRGRGDFDKLNSDPESKGDKLEGEIGRARSAGDIKGMENAGKCAAANYEVAGADTLQARGHQWADHAQRNYQNAGIDRTFAGAGAATIGDQKKTDAENAKNYGKKAENYAEAAKNYGEAARNNGKAQADFKLADELATKAGNKDDAVDDYVKAKSAGNAAAENYGEAAKNYGEAARSAKMAGHKNDAADYHRKAAENYGKAAEIYGDAAKSATEVGNTREAGDYQKKEKEAADKQAAEEKMIKPKK
jgi:hypothetical protein